ncbi:MAG: DUF7347 domain-containing protein [Nitrososphaeria archaeon]
MSSNFMTKRLKVIFSVLASKSRLEILKILAAKGGMTYTELKEASGFTPKRESGKFAYHLKKLVQQNLVIQNKQERKYMIAPLGRLVLSLAKQIEEESLVTSGRLYVRESSQRIEEFDPSKIVQSLIKEANVPLEVAQNIASEAESRIYKFQITYLTSPLIREIVNSILLEQGMEHYWKKLSRLGMPVYDLEVLLDETSKREKGFEEAVYKAAERIFSDYLLRSDLPTDLVDAHYNGEIHLPYSDAWMFRPDVIAVNVNALYEADRLLTSNGISSFVDLVYGLTREANAEVFIKISPDLIESLGREPFFILHDLLPSTTKSPILTVHIDEPSDQIVEQYSDYYYKVNRPRVLLSTGSVSRTKDLPLLLVNREGKTANGFRLNNQTVELGIIAASINLPHIAGEAQYEESYFKVKVLLLKDVIQDAIAQRNKLLISKIQMGLLPTLKKLIMKHPSDYITTTVNLSGLKESMVMLNVSEGSVIDKEAELVDLLHEKVGYPISWIQDDSGERLALLDVQRLGKKQQVKPYSLGVEVGQHDDVRLREARELNKHLKGGLFVTSEVPLDDKLSYLYREKEISCKICGWSNPARLQKCRHCGAPLELVALK